jgi:hypothetical protein
MRTTAAVFATVAVLLRLAVILLLFAFAAGCLLFAATLRMTRYVLSGL